KSRPDVVSAGIRLADGRDFALSGPVTKLPAGEPLPNARFEGQELVVARSITLDREHLGTLYVRANFQATYRDLVQLYTSVLVAVLGLSLALAALVSTRLQRLISGPILRLAETARVIAEKNDYSVRASDTCGGELGLFTKAFNQMLAQIESQNAAIRESEARYRLLFQSSPMPKWVHDVETLAFLAVNDAAVETYGYSEAEFLSKTIAEIHRPEDLSRLRDEIVKPHSELARSSGWKHQRKDGVMMDVEITSHPIVFRDRPAQLVLAIDVTERNRSEAEKARLEAQLRQAQKMEAIGTLAGGIAHDFNNILGAIVGYTELVKTDAAGNEQVLQHMEEVSRASKRATDLVRQILSFSRQDEQERQPVQLRPIIKEALKLLRATLPSSIEIRSDLDPAAPTVLADPTQIHQIMMNLGTNAWHAMLERPGTLHAKLVACDVDADFAKLHAELRVGSYVRLSVSDTGHGMDSATLGRIFEPFFTTKAPGKGTGLGLAMVHGIMKGHDGAITVYSQPGEGTTFHLYFPALQSASADTESLARPIPRGHGEHVLFVDDEAPLARWGRETLERLGYRVTTHTNALEAIAAVRGEPGQFDLVVTDLTMPVMNGLNLGRRLLEIRSGLPIVLTTGYSATLTEESVRKLGIRELLFKPNTAQTLGEAIDRVLAQNHRG
ncbi:MAG TPA: ATP-binding protein, partial [Candidatus Angelobacter sp.]|nr:ATP-binding protein [Candidatus Angelobacter sp.]